MQNREKWKPSKFIYTKGKLVASRDEKELNLAFRLIATLTAEFYDRNLKQYAKGKLLDLGCGKVPLYEAYRDYVTDIICVDWDKSIYKNIYLDFELDLTKTLPFADNEFDTIILSDVLEHIPVPEHLWKEMARVLSRNGKLIMNVPFYYWIHEKPYDYYRYTEYALRRFVELSGLRVVQLKPIGGALEVMVDIFANNINRLPKLGRLLSRFAQWFTLRFKRTRYGKKLLEATSDKFPLGYFLVAEKPQ
ncbi:MAG: class I SAM-dependent methyltransferase [Sedimentisphaerales bacterium]|nr:class I SAM-dependent methyltransferase [Sedimentisphaerales bacterium]